MQAKAKAKTVCRGAYEQLGFGVPAFDSRHEAAAGLGAQRVHIARGYSRSPHSSRGVHTCAHGRHCRVLNFFSSFLIASKIESVRRGALFYGFLPALNACFAPYTHLHLRPLL